MFTLWLLKRMPAGPEYARTVRAGFAPDGALVWVNRAGMQMAGGCTRVDRCHTRGRDVGSRVVPPATARAVFDPGSELRGEIMSRAPLDEMSHSAQDCPSK